MMPMAQKPPKGACCPTYSPPCSPTLILRSPIRKAPAARQVYVCGGGIRNQALMARLSALLAPQQAALHSTAELQLDPQWVEAAAFGWLAACWINRTPAGTHHATGAHKPCILGAGHYA